MMLERTVTVEAVGGSQYRVTIKEGETATVHEVIASPQLVERWSRSDCGTLA